MPRLREVPLKDADPFARDLYSFIFGDRDPVEKPGTDTGTPGNWWTVFALVPDVLKHAVKGFSLYRDPDRKLNPQLWELSQTRAGYARGSKFVFSQHCKSCRAVGLTEEKIAAIPHWQVSKVFSTLERAVLAYADALVNEGGRVSDALFEELKNNLSDEEILELTYITSLYDMHATIAKALRLEYDDIEESVCEVMAPAHGPHNDVMRMVDNHKPEIS